MSETELQDWLYETSVRGELQQLGLVTTLLELDNVTEEPALEDVTFDWPRLLFAASILARSKKRLHREASLRIATGAMLLPTSDPVRDAAAVLFDKLVNAILQLSALRIVPFQFIQFHFKPDHLCPRGITAVEPLGVGKARSVRRRFYGDFVQKLQFLVWAIHGSDLHLE